MPDCSFRFKFIVKIWVGHRVTEDLASLIQECERLASGVDFYRKWQIEQYKQEYGHEPDLRGIVQSSSFFLLPLREKQSKRNANFVLKELKTWYSFAAGDIRNLEKTGNDALKASIRNFYRDFLSETGFDFRYESRLSQKTVKKVIAQGRILSRVDWEIISDILNDTSEEEFDDSTKEKLGEMLVEYEAQA